MKIVKNFVGKYLKNAFKNCFIFSYKILMNAFFNVSFSHFNLANSSFQNYSKNWVTNCLKNTFKIVLKYLAKIVHEYIFQGFFLKQLVCISLKFLQQLFENSILKYFKRWFHKLKILFLPLLPLFCCVSMGRI